MLNKAIEINPSNTNIHLSLASTIEKQGDVNEAIRVLKEAIEIDPSNVDIYIDLADSSRNKDS